MSGVYMFCFGMGALCCVSPLIWKGQNVFVYCTYILFGAVCLFCGVGVIQRKDSARKLLQWLFTIFYGGGAISMFFSPQAKTIPLGVLLFMVVFLIAISIYCFRYLDTVAMKEHFNK